MNTLLRTQWILCGIACALAGSSLAQVNNAVPPSVSHIAPTNHTAITREPSQSQQFCRTKDLVGADVKDIEGHTLGIIDDILFNPKNGEAFVAVGIGGGVCAVVPSQALKVTTGAGLADHKADVTLNASPE